MDRPTFYTEDNEPIRAGGIIFYYKSDSKSDSKSDLKSDSTYKLLLQYTTRTIRKVERNVYEDIGGKTDIVDKCIKDVLTREVVEETNDVITKADLIKYLSKEYVYIYIPECKYYLALIPADIDLININRYKFGKVEKTTGKIRQFYWIDISKLKQKYIFFNERINGIRTILTDYFDKLN
jgi:hypothetical protein